MTKLPATILRVTQYWPRGEPSRIGQGSCCPRTQLASKHSPAKDAVPSCGIVRAIAPAVYQCGSRIQLENQLAKNGSGGRAVASHDLQRQADQFVFTRLDVFQLQSFDDPDACF